MRVAYVLRTYGAPSETFIISEMEEVRRQGHEIRAFSWRLETGQHGTQHVAATKVSSWAVRPRALARCARAARLLDPQVAGRRKLAECVLVAAAMLPGIEEFGPDVLHAHFASAPTLVALILGRVLERPVTAMFHATDYRVGVSPHNVGARISELDAVFAVSERAALELGEYSTAVARRKVLVVRAARRRLVAEVKPSSGVELHVGVCVARLVEKKGHRLLLQGLHEFRRRREWCPTIFLVGTGPAEQEINRLIAELDLESFVVRTGQLSHADTLALISVADFAIFTGVVDGTGDADGIPVFLMEAAALKVPVISTTVGGIDELIISDRTGVVVHGSSPGDVADAFEEAQTVAWGDITASAFALVDSEFGPQRQAERLTGRWQSLQA